MFNSFVGYSNIVPVLASVDMASTVTATNYVDLKGAHRCAFLVILGAVTSATTTDREEITVEAATAVDGAEAAVTFKYRLSGAVGANTWGAVTSAAVAGISLDPAADDNKCVWIEVDPDALAASDYRYVRLKFTDNPDMTAALAGVVAILESRYKQATHISATASASA